MSATALICTTFDGVVKGRTLHNGGPFDNEILDRIVVRDGVDKAIQTLVHDHYGWSSIDDDQDDTLERFYDDGRFVAVPGYGVAYTSCQVPGFPDDYRQSRAEQWYPVDEPGIDYVFIIHPDGTVTR